MNKELHGKRSMTSVVKTVASDLKEDYEKIKAECKSLAVRGIKKLTNESLRDKVYRDIIPINKNFSTAPLPVGFSKDIFVGILDSTNSRKMQLKRRDDLVPYSLEQPECVDKCPSCNQDKDICEFLQVEVERNAIVVNGEDKEEVITKYYENGNYYLVTDTWIHDTVEDEVVPYKYKKFVEKFDLLSCNCIAPTEENITKINHCCNECYLACYSPCCGDEYTDGYKIFEDEGYIQFDRKLTFDKVYLEWSGCIPKINGEYWVPDVAFECLVAYVKEMYNADRRGVTPYEKTRLYNKFRHEQGIMDQIIGRVSLGEIFYALK